MATGIACSTGRRRGGRASTRPLASIVPSSRAARRFGGNGRPYALATGAELTPERGSAAGPATSTGSLAGLCSDTALGACKAGPGGVSPRRTRMARRLAGAGLGHVGEAPASSMVALARGRVGNTSLVASSLGSGLAPLGRGVSTRTLACTPA